MLLSLLWLMDIFNIFSALIPAISAMGAFALGQEQLSGLRIAGIAIVIAGVILAQREK